MEHSVLITGKQSAFTDDLVQELLKRLDRVYASFDESDTAPEVPDSFGDSLRYIPWTRRSLISSRSLLLAVAGEIEAADAGEGGGARAGGEVAAGGLSRAVVVCAPEGINAALHDTEAATIEERIDVAVKGYLFVIRELAALFIRRGGGDLTILWYDPGVEVLPPVDAAIAGAVEGLTRSMLAFYENEDVSIRGLSASHTDGPAVALWALEQILDRTAKSVGRFQRYGQRMSLLPFRR